MLLFVTAILSFLKEEYSLCIVDLNLIFDPRGKIFLVPDLIRLFPLFRRSYLLYFVFDLLGLVLGLIFESKSFNFRFRHRIKQIHIIKIHLHGCRRQIHRCSRELFKPGLIVLRGIWKLPTFTFWFVHVAPLGYLILYSFHFLFKIVLLKWPDIIQKLVRLTLLNTELLPVLPLVDVLPYFNHPVVLE